MSIDDLTWIVPLLLLLAAIARRIRIRKLRDEFAVAYELEKYIADCHGRPHPVIRYRD